MKVTVVVEDMDPAIHMGASVERVSRQFDLSPEIADYIARHRQRGMTTVVSLILVDEPEDSRHG